MRSIPSPHIDTTPDIICPTDHARLATWKCGYECPVCKRTYPVDEGIVRLLDCTDEFYEGAYQGQVQFVPKSEKIWHVWPIWLINSAYPWFVRYFVPSGSEIVELGCAGGLRYFGQRYRMIGCDISFSSLRKLADIYQYRIQADVSACIPLPDNSADAVVSSYFWEHIPPERKPSILSECFRVLRPNGKIIFLYDVETENPLIRHYKKSNPNLYRRLFIEGDGHLGYQSPDINKEMFLQAGFRIISLNGYEKTPILSPSVYTKLGQFEGWAAHVYKQLRRLGEAPWFYPYTALMRIVDTAICPWLPKNWARINLIVCEKKPHEYSCHRQVL